MRGCGSEDRVCEYCGDPAQMHINDLWFCWFHARQGAVQEARMEAFRQGAPLATIRMAGRFMEEALDSLGLGAQGQKGTHDDDGPMG